MTAAINHSENKISLDELIFINKEYGAYKLRRNYEQNLSVSLFITIILFTGFISYTLFNKNENEIKIPVVNKLNVPIDLINVEIEKHKTEYFIPEKIKTFKPMIKYLEPKILDDAMVAENIPFPTQDDLANKTIGTQDLNGDPTGIEILPEEILPVGNANTEIGGTPFTWAEEMPKFQGSDAALLNFIAQNIKYPPIAIKAGIKGKVIVGFIVERDGSLSDINILKSIGGGCDEEAVRVLKLTGNWNPGKQNGIPVRVRMTIPFVFSLK